MGLFLIAPEKWGFKVPIPGHFVIPKFFPIPKCPAVSIRTASIRAASIRVT